MKKDNRKPLYQKDKNIINKKTSIISEKKNSSLLFILIAFFLPILLYLQTINFGFTYFDDDGLIIKNINFLSNFGNVHKAFLTDASIIKFSSFYRPMQTLSYMIDIKLSGGNNTWMYHLSNTLILGLISCSLFLLLKRFSIPSKLALLSALIYCVHPLFVSTVAFIPTRGELLLTLFSLLSFLFFIDFLQKGKFKYLFLHWASFTIALFCKETAALLPVVIIIYYFTFQSIKHFKKKHLFIIMLYAISGIFWFWFRNIAIGGISNHNDTVGLMPILSNLRIIPEALSKFFLPFDFAPIPSFSILKTLVGAVIIIIIIILFLKYSKQFKKEKIFCFAWFIILLFPSMLYKHPHIDYLDHRFFLPLIGILLFLLFIFSKKWLEKGALKSSWLIIAVIIFLSSFTVIKSRAYSDPTTFYNYAISHNTNSSFAYNNRGYLKSTKNDYKGAVEDFDKAIAISQNFIDAYYNRGIVRTNLGDFKGAIEDFNKAISIRKNYADAYYNRGVANMGLQNFQDAIKDFDNAISINPNYAEAYNNKGYLQCLNKKYNEAIINFNKAIDINSKYLDAYYNKALAKYCLKDFTGAIEDCENTLNLSPKDERAIKLKTQAQQLQKMSK